MTPSALAHLSGDIANGRTSTTVQDFFEFQVDLQPDRPAIEFEDQVLTYVELDNYANRIASFLRSRDIGPERLVGVCLVKSCRLFACILGILKAGAAYVPIDPETPRERIKHIAVDANLALLLTEDELLHQIEPDLGVAVISLDERAAEISGHSPSRLCSSETGVTPSNACYVIYTSGSTGRPKGVVLEHRNVINFICGMHSHYGLFKTDRIYQGFSVAFDASVEEIWAAFSVGGTLVVPPTDVAKSPIDAAAYINEREITYFSTVPTFLSLITTELPSVRLLILGGEVCPAQLVSRWANGQRRLLNTYGPTETAVVATLATCIPGGSVTIGEPMRGYSCRVLNQDLQDVSPGTIGELFIGGGSVARGYLNLPQHTAEDFISLPSSSSIYSQRFYRTRDLVRLNDEGALEFIGRSDTQIKIRGYRVELTEIESVLMEHPSILLAAAVIHELKGHKEIAAYIKVSGSFGLRQQRGVADLVSSRLPAYMHPKFLEVVDAFPTLVAGKVDRSRFPPPKTPFVVSDGPYVGPANNLEAAIAEVWKKHLQLSLVSTDADFFLDLKGNSVSAAHVASELRAELDTAQLSSRDLYKHRTIQGIARHLLSLGVLPSAEKAIFTTPADPVALNAMHVNLVTRWVCLFLQSISLLMYYAATSAPLVLLIIISERVHLGQMEIGTAALYSTVVGFATWPAWLAISIAVKWLVIGRYKAGRYPVWGLYYFRWWVSNRFQGLGWPEMFSGTPLMSLYYRAMGATVGKNACIGTPLCSAFDLVSIGDNTSIGVGVQLLGYRVESGWLMLGNVDIGDECFVGMHSTLGLDIQMSDGSRIGDMSLLSDRTALLKHEQRAGSPLVEASVNFPQEMEKAAEPSRGVLYGFLHLALIYAMGYFLIVSLLPSVTLVLYSLYRWGILVAILSVFAAAPLTIVSYALLAISVKRIVIGRMKPGIFSMRSVQYLRYWFLDYLMNNTRQILLPLYGTIFLPGFLRLMGAKVGRGVEISTIMHVVPDLLEVEDGSFLADACIIGGHRMYKGRIEVRPNKIGRRSFIGNSAIVPGGVDVGRDNLIAVMSVAPGNCERVSDGTRWLGSPSFELPHQSMESCFRETQTYSPGLGARCMRMVFDTLRILLPGMIAASEFVIFAVVVVCLDYVMPLWFVLAVSPVVVLHLSFATLTWTARVKSILIGRFKPTIKPLWSSFVWLNEVVNGIYETVAAAALAPLMGTPYLPVLLRKMGCKIGRWVFLDTTLFSEFDLVEIGDYAALNMGCTVQTHLFEDRVMKADYLKIGAGCSVGNMAVVLYGSEMKTGSVLAPLSVLMKDETLPPGSRWYGIPNEAQGTAAVCAAAVIHSQRVNGKEQTNEHVDEGLVVPS